MTLQSGKIFFQVVLTHPQLLLLPDLKKTSTLLYEVKQEGKSPPVNLCSKNGDDSWCRLVFALTSITKPSQPLLQTWLCLLSHCCCFTKPSQPLLQPCLCLPPHCCCFTAVPPFSFLKGRVAPHQDMIYK